MQYQFDADFATLYGVDEAIFVHRIYYWVRQNRANDRHFIDGRYWTYDSMTALTSQDIFGFWSKRQLERIIKSCKDKGLILTADYNENRYNRPQWYTVTDKVLQFYEGAVKRSEDPAPEPLEAAPETVPTMAPNGDNGVPEPCRQSSPNRDVLIGTIKRPLEDQLESESAPTPEKPEEEVTLTVPEDAVVVICGEFANVSIAKPQLDKLLEQWPENIVLQEIDALSCYMASKGKKYKNHYATLLNWLRRDYPDGPPKASGSRIIDEEWIND